jgi:hypothetical protein
MYLILILILIPVEKFKLLNRPFSGTELDVPRLATPRSGTRRRWPAVRKCQRSRPAAWTSGHGP